MSESTHDLVIVGGTPGGIMAAIAAAREGLRSVILERSAHIGGLPANGLGATDIKTRGATRGLFHEFVHRVLEHYATTYGLESEQVRDCDSGYHFEPHVAEQVFEEMIAEHDGRITVRLNRQFDARPERVSLRDGGPRAVTVTDRSSGREERYGGGVFIDATYEGDLAAAAGARFRLGREGRDEFGEPMAGKLYKPWMGEPGPGSTGEGDEAIQAYNYRMCLTRRENNRMPIPRPPGYDRNEYVSIIDDIRLDRVAGRRGGELEFDGIGRVVNMVTLPNGKVDANNQHLAFLSTDLPEENQPWPTADWAWRDRFAERLRNYTLGLLWFVQHDEELPEDFRARCAPWGLARDEYVDNGCFPRQVYVREARRVEGEYLFTAHDALPVSEGARPPVHAASITASHYPLDSHAVHKREPDRVHLDGFFSARSFPYTAPFGVMVPRDVENLLTPVPASATHVGYSTLRMEPCWMALGEAAGTAAALSLADLRPVRNVSVAKLQQRLLNHGTVLMYFKDAAPGDAHYEALQFFAVRGFDDLDGWEARLDEPVTERVAEHWIETARAGRPEVYASGESTRGELLDLLYRRVQDEHGGAIATSSRM